MNPGRVFTKFLIIAMSMMALVMTAGPASARRAVVITYDISQSMLGPKNPQTGPRKTAEELEATARAVMELVFNGEPFDKPEFREFQKNCSFSKQFRSDSKSVWSPFWRPGDDLYFITYGGKILDYQKITDTPQYTTSQLWSKIWNKMPYPRGVSGKPRNETWKAFKDAFRDTESLQKLAEVEALKILDQMVVNGDPNAEVIWVSVSDEDTDTTEYLSAKSEHQRLSQNLATIKDKYREMQDFFAFQILAANLIWVRVRVLSLVDTGYSKEEIEQYLTQIEEAKRKAELARQAILEERRKNEEAFKAAEEEKRMRKEAALAADRARKEARAMEQELRQAHEQLEQIGAVRNEAQKLHLFIDGREFTDSRVNCQVMLRRVPADDSGRNFKLTLPNISFVTGPEVSDSDFKIEEITLQIRDAGSNPIGHYRLDPKPIREALDLSVSDDPNLRHDAAQATLTTKYLYRGHGDTDDKPYTKTWNFDHFTLPSPGWLAENFWLPILILGLLVVGLVFLVAKNIRRPEPFVPSQPAVRPTSPISRRTHYSGRPEKDAGLVEPSPGKKALLTVHRGGNYPPFELDGNHPIEVMLGGGQRRASRGSQIWDLDAPNHQLTWDGRVLALNGSPISGKTFEITNGSGKTLKIKYQIL